MKLIDIIKIINHDNEGNIIPDIDILGVASLKDATESDISFYTNNKKNFSVFQTTKAAAVLVPIDFTMSTEHAAILLKTSNPSATFSQIATIFLSDNFQYQPGIHSSAVVDSSVILGQNVSISAGVVIEADVVIGSNVVIGAGSFIGRKTSISDNSYLYPRVTIHHHSKIGKNVKIQSGAVIGSYGFGYYFSDGKHQPIPQLGIVEIGDDVEIGSNTTIDRARFGKTVIGEGTKIDNLVQIAHNVHIGSHVIICGQVGIAGTSTIGSYSMLGGQVGIADHVNIGENVMIGAQSGVLHHVNSHQKIFGSPSQSLTDAKRNFGYMLRLEKLFKNFKKIAHSVQKIEEKLNQ